MPIYLLCLLEYCRTAKKPLCKKTIRLESYFISVLIISLSLPKLVFVVVVFVLLDFRREKHDFMQPAVIIKSYLSPCSLLTNKFCSQKVLISQLLKRVTREFRTNELLSFRFQGNNFSISLEFFHFL